MDEQINGMVETIHKLEKENAELKLSLTAVNNSLPLPTDDEIKNAAPCCPEADRMDIQAHNWFIAGAKWCKMVVSIPSGNDR